MNKDVEYINSEFKDLCVSDSKITPQALAKKAYKKTGKILEEMFLGKTFDIYEELTLAVDDLSVNILNKALTIEAMAKLMSHDYYTHTHSINVGLYAMYFASFKGWSAQDVKDIGISGMLHDIGKVNVPQEIISKPTFLTPLEYESVKSHSNDGYRLALSCGITKQTVIGAIRCHHEKLDGSGYPMGLKGADIPYFAKIISVCDIFDALTTKRSYKDPYQTFEAIKLMKKEMKNELDQDVLFDFIKMFAIND